MSPPPSIKMLNSSSDFEDFSSTSSFNDASSFILGDDDYEEEEEVEGKGKDYQTIREMETNPHDIKISLEIRKKYGIPNTENEVKISTKKPSPTTSTATTITSSEDPEHFLLFETMKSLTSFLLGKHLIGEIHDPNAIGALLSLIEISLLHGMRSSEKNLWILLQRLPKWSTSSHTKGVLKATEDFTSTIKAPPLNKVRCWIRYALMAKTIASDLTLLINNDNSLILSNWESWSFILSSFFQPFLALLSKMDIIDFNIFFKERDISYPEVKNMRELFGRDQMNFIQFSPPISLDWKMVKSYNNNNNNNNNKDKDDKDDVDENLLSIENQKLRKALLAQMTERAFYQASFNGSQSKGALLFGEQQRLSNRVDQLERQLRESLLVIEAHERTNKAMQQQISMAYENNDQELMDKYGLLFREFSKEKILSSQKSSAIADLQKKIERQRSIIENIKRESHMKLEEVEGRWNDRCRSLQEQLSLSNALKEKYHRALNK